MQRKEGDIVWKKAGAGFHSGRLLVQLDPIERPDDIDNCYVCNDENCCGWANLTVLNKDKQPIGKVYHVSECQMEDYNE